MYDGSDPRACRAALHRLYGATVAYREELERARPAAERMRGLGDKRATPVLESIIATLGTLAPEQGSLLDLEAALRACLFMEVDAGGRFEQRP